MPLDSIQAVVLTISPNSWNCPFPLQDASCDSTAIETKAHLQITGIGTQCNLQIFDQLIEVVLTVSSKL